MVELKVPFVSETFGVGFGQVFQKNIFYFKYALCRFVSGFRFKCIVMFVVS